MLFNKKQTAMILAAIIAVSFLACLFFLFQSPLLPGQDAPYYLRGVESIQRTGFLPASFLEWPPVFFYAAALFSVFFGTIAGIKIAAALFTALLAFSVFLLARQLLKSNEAALVSALFALIAPATMRLLNGFWKTSAALFFLPLFFYFFFREEKSRKNLFLSLLILLLVFLSHKLAGFLALLVLLAFVVFQLVFERKISIEAKNSAIVFAIGAFFVLVVFAVSGKGFQEMVGMFGLINSMESGSASASLWQYFSVLVIPAFFGALYCFFGAKREHLFLLAWFFAGLFVAFPLTSGSNYWRFAFLLSAPFALLSGLFFAETKKTVGNFNSALVFVLVFALALQQSYNAAVQIVPIFNEKEIVEIKQLADFSSDAIIFSKGMLLEWLKYEGANAFDVRDNIVLEAKQPWLEGKKAFLAVDKQRKMLDFTERDWQSISSNFVLESDSNRFALLKPDLNLLVPAFNPIPPEFSERQMRYSNPVLWLFFPAEFFNVVILPFNSVLRALVGLPLSFAFIAFILFWLKKLENKKNFRFAAFVFMAFLILLIAIAK